MPLSLVPEWAKPLRPLEGIARKLVLLFIALSAVGWIVFVGGFGVFAKRFNDDTSVDVSDFPQFYYVYVPLVVGPVLFLLAALHAVLWRWPSSAVGSVTAFLGIGYISAIGIILNISGGTLSSDVYDSLNELTANLWFSGAFLSCLFWAGVQVMWLWYPVTSVRNITKIRPFKPLTGLSRKVVLPFIALSAIGWVVYVAGFVKYLQSQTSSDNIGDHYWAWAASVAGLVLHILAVVHAVLWGLPSLIAGSLTAVLGVFYTIAVGYGLHVAGIELWLGFLLDDFSKEEETSYRLLFAGGFLSCLFWAVVQAMWPWYTTGLETEEEVTEDRQKLRKWVAFKPCRPLEGIVRKIVLIFIGLSVAGWIVFVAGFGQYIKWSFDQPPRTRLHLDVFNTLLYRNDFDLESAPYLYWGWIVSLGGPVVYLLAVAHAVMWTRISCILGSMTAILGTLFVSAAAYRLVQSGINLYYAKEGEDTSATNYNLVIEAQEYDRTLFSGGLLLCLFWVVMQSVWPWYPYGSISAIKISWSKVTRVRILEGSARKMALFFLLLSLVGWMVFVAGFCELVKAYENNTPDVFDLGDSPFLYWAWAASVVGPVVYILAVVHAVLWGLPSAIVGSLTAILGMVYITGIGCGLITSGITVDRSGKLNVLLYFLDYRKSWKLMFGGSLAATLFWGLVQAMWPWYSSDESGYTSIPDNRNGQDEEEVELQPK